ncbi:MAG TPA: hemerythrin domain-containing protein [Thermoplasmata archaeon]|nr:hemerythrin domain-containing protein [Thermoplasmata archaeon]
MPGTKYDPIETLMREHREYETRMRDLEVALATDPGSAGGGAVPRKVAEFSAFFEREVEGFHGRKEETALFPALARYLPSPGPVEVMVADHRQMRSNEQEMKRGATRLESDPGSIEALGGMVCSGTDLISLLLHHIQKEDNVLFPTARNVLLPREMEEVAEACRSIDESRGR